MFVSLPFVEIEVRLGTFSNTFDNSIDSKYFNQILSELEKYTNWVDVEVNNTTEYINKNMKLINDTTLIMKEHVIKKDIQLKNSPFDIRFCVNQEFLMNSNKDSFQKSDSFVRQKSRKSFIGDNFRYDLTIVRETINNIPKDKFEIEIELLVNNETLQWNTDYIYDFLQSKIYDLVVIVEPVENFQVNFK